jgi:hypothetical protein
MIRRFVRALVVLCAVSAAGVSHAAVYYDSFGHLSSITDVSVTAVSAAWGSTGPADPKTRYFDVSFESGNYQDVYGISTGLPTGWLFNSLNLGSAAAKGLAAALNDQGIAGTTLFLGGAGEPFIPYYVGEVIGSSFYCSFCVQYRQVDFQGSPADWRDPGTSYFVTLTTSATWAKFTEVTSPVPEPEIYAMLGMGLGLMGWAARRRKLKETA